MLSLYAYVHFQYAKRMIKLKGYSAKYVYDITLYVYYEAKYCYINYGIFIPFLAFNQHYLFKLTVIGATTKLSQMLISLPFIIMQNAYIVYWLDFFLL